MMCVRAPLSSRALHIVLPSRVTLESWGANWAFQARGALEGFPIDAPERPAASPTPHPQRRHVPQRLANLPVRPEAIAPASALGNARSPRAVPAAPGDPSALTSRPLPPTTGALVRHRGEEVQPRGHVAFIGQALGRRADSASGGACLPRDCAPSGAVLKMARAAPAAERMWP